LKNGGFSRIQKKAEKFILREIRREIVIRHVERETKQFLPPFLLLLLLLLPRETTSNPLCVRNAVTHATLGRVDQGPNRHGYCTQPLPSHRQGHERNLPSLAVEPQLQGTQGKGRLMRVCGLRRLASPTVEGVRRAPGLGSSHIAHVGSEFCCLFIFVSY